MTWGEVDATDPTYGGLSSDPAADPLNNANALRAAYRDAVQRQLALYIPAGTYRLELRKHRTELAHVLALNAYWDGTYNADGSGHLENALAPVPIIGAGSSLTRLEFVYPTDVPSECYGLWMSSSAVGPARVEGMTLALAEWVGGAIDVDEDPSDGFLPTTSDGMDAPRTFGVYLQKGASLVMVDVATTGWNTAVASEGTAVDEVTMFLERCHIMSRGSRVTAGAGRTTLVDCTIEHDEDGFIFANDSFWVGVYVGRDTQLTILGGRSLRSKGVYAIHGQHLRSAVIKDHYFGPEVATGMQVWASTGDVLVDNCTFECGSGIFIAGNYTTTGTYHVTNCRFNVPGAPIGDYKHWTEEVEVHFTNCSFVSSSDTYAVVGRFFGQFARPWYFSNCQFEAVGRGGLVRVIEGVLIFTGCQFATRGATTEYVISQSHGRLELYDCDIQAAGNCLFSTLSYEDVYAGGVYQYTKGRYTDEVITRALTFVLDGCRISNLQMYFQPFNPIYLMGRDNEFMRSRLEMWHPYPLRRWYAGEKVNQDLEPLDEAVTDFSALVSDLQFSRGVGSCTYAPIVWESSTPHPELAHYQIGFDGDLLRVAGAPVPIASLFVPQNRPYDRVRDGTANCGAGATLELVAIDTFTLAEGGLAGGEIMMGGAGSVVVAPNSVATLRYSTTLRAWVLVTVS